MARILIVDDEATNVEVATVICEAAGHSVDVARNGQEAIDVLVPGKYDIVLMDLLMPVLDGISATQQIRAKSEFASLAILGVTAVADHEEHFEMRSAGMNGVLEKPYRNKHLLAAIAEAMAASELTLIIPRQAPNQIQASA
jgi:CheY-like chemotaxis protein